MSSGLRIGHGYDVHRRAVFTAKRGLVLGGVEFSREVALVGHSDADVAAHALIDAMATACGAGDIGTLFPDSDPAYANADSIDLLGRCTATLAAKGWRLQSADITVVADTPKLAPHRAEMTANLTAAAGGPVTLSGRRTERWAALGRFRRVEAYAVALMTNEAEDSGDDG